MIAPWMLHAVIVGGCLGIGALAAERLLAARGWPRRIVWAAAMGAAVLLPLTGALRLSRDAAVPPAAVGSTRIEDAGSAFRLPTWTIGAPSTGSETPWVVAWIVLSTLVGARVVRARVGLARALRSASPELVAGERVWIVADGAPALVGLVAPRIVMPAWLREADAALQQLVVTHEREHARAGDAWLVHVTALLLVLLPWNVALWGIAVRLRRAIELDCDQRVLARHPDPTRYGRLLLLIAQHRTRGVDFIAPALGEPVTLTEDRIMAISRPVRLGPLATALSLGVSLLAVGSACTAEQAVDPPSSAIEGSEAAPTSSAAAQVEATEGTATAAETPPLAVRGVGDTVFFEFLVETPASVEAGAKAPLYPAAELARGESGDVLVQYVVDREGRPDMTTFKVIRSSGEAFSDAVREAVAEMPHRPAQRGGQPVSQLVQQPFGFRMRSDAGGR